MAGYIGSGASVVSSGVENKKVFDITTNTTSLTGLNYTVGKVHVYHNGVRLVDGTDFTATNSTSIALTVAAVSGDQVVVVSYASFQLSEHYTKAETDALVSSSIDDNGNATALTIDSNENVMLGNTVPNPASGFASQAGFGYTASTGVVEVATTANTAPMEIGKNNSNDGQLIALRKQGTTVGSIGTNQSVAQYSGSTMASFGAGDVGIFVNSNNDAVYPVYQTTLSGRDAAIDLGLTTNRFKDAYLSGGIHLGGTGAANKLADYEEGFTTVSTITTSGSITLNSSVNRLNYTKVGRVVTITGRIRVSSVSSPSGSLKIVLPFVIASTTQQSGHAFLNGSTHDVNLGSGAIGSTWECNAGTSDAYLLVLFNNASWQSNNVAQKFDGSGNEYIAVTGSYVTT